MRAYTVSFLALAALVFAVFAIGMTKLDASTGYGNEYYGTQITSSDVGTSSLKYSAGTIGSVVVSSTSPVTTAGPVIAFYDSSSTTIATTSMTAKFEVGAEGAVTPSMGTYQFDVIFANGIYVWVDPSFNGSYTVTYR